MLLFRGHPWMSSEMTGYQCLGQGKTVPTSVAMKVVAGSSRDVDLFTQARKCLSERSPFDVPEDGAGTLGVAATVLPSSLASLLRNTDSRRKHKRSHSGGEKKSSKKRQGDQSKVCRIWTETEEYFRELALSDIDCLHDACCSVHEFGHKKKCMLVPFLDGDVSQIGVVVGEDAGAYEKENKEEESGQHMDIDSVGNDEEAVCSVSGSSSSLEIEWLLGCKEKVCLASERPSKKRKLLGSDAGLEKVLIAHPCEGIMSLCSFCCSSELSRDSNPLLLCSSCKMAVHRKCYGVQEDVNDSWLCSWCVHKVDEEIYDGYPCVLCPKKGGALKPVHRGDEYEGQTEFAHLFCSLWMSEVYIEDLKKMEPIMNVEEINSTRKRLVCNICKIKSGACVRCSHGSCRTSFHPICARESSYRMEIWGKLGQDDVELRAFCSKHSLANAKLSQSGSPTVVACVNLPDEKRYESSGSGYCYENGENGSRQLDAQKKSSEADSNKRLQDIGLPVTRSRARSRSESSEQEHGQMDKPESVTSHEEDSADSLNFVLILKKLVDLGKVNLKDVASEIGIPLNILDAKLSDNSFVPDLRRKLVSWLKNHAYMGARQKDMKIKVKPSMMAVVDDGPTDGSDTETVSDSDMSNPVAVKCVPPRRRTKSDARVPKDCKYSRKGNCKGTGSAIGGEYHNITGKVDKSANFCLSDTREKTMAETDSSEQNSPEDSGIVTGAAENSQLKLTPDPESSIFTNAHPDPEVCGVVKAEPVRSFFMHPCTRRTLVQIHGLERGFSLRADSSFDANIYGSNNHPSMGCDVGKHGSEEVATEQLAKAAKMGILEMSPKDEVEEEILYFQNRLLSNAAVKKQLSDILIAKITKDLPREIGAAHCKIWDIVLVNKYLSELREAKKQGRKERKHKEAQAILAAATAAAAASSRVSSLRKDGLDGTPIEENLLKFNSTSGRVGYCSQLIPQPKGAVSKLGLEKVSDERNADLIHAASGDSKHSSRICDICTRQETLMNPILVCSSCKVSVHSDCYHSVKESTGPWHCELCEEFRGSGSPSKNFMEKFVSAAECALCGGTTGAFRKSAAGQWVHAFCAEWVLESTFTRGQVNPVEGMDAIPKEVNECNICHHRFGACIKCNYGHCQSTFHPSCARSVGLFMNVKSVGGKMQHKAYCGKHSLEQKAKAESQKYGIEDLKSVKQMRVELEKLRLLCERIVKREKVKREIVLCTRDMLALKRNMVARSFLVPSLFADGSSESATTSVNYRSVSESIQKSDEMTVDSGMSRKRQPGAPSRPGRKQNREDSSLSHSLVTGNPTQKVSYSRKQIPHRPPIPSRNASNDGDLRIKFKCADTFEKELVMTSDQADLKNKLLPKGYAYVPSDSIPKDKGTSEDTGSDEKLEDGG